MSALRRSKSLTLFAWLVVVAPVFASAQKPDASGSETQAQEAVCQASCNAKESAAKAVCGTSCTVPAETAVCDVSETSCGTLTTVGFDPARNAETGGPRVTAADLGFEALDLLLEPVRAKYRVPALAVAVARSDGVFGVGAVGVRVAGAGPLVTPTDRFHLGSCGKSITASVAARMVERDEITWDATIGDIFGDYPEVARSVYRSVTLGQLLAHRAGFPHRDDAVMQRIWALEGDNPNQRGEFVRMALQLPPAAEPNSAFLYSDVGYTVAGVMLERASKTSWEDLVEVHVAVPLGLSSLGFGEPATPGAMDQPWGHIADGTRTVPFSPGPYAEIDNPAVIGPAGLVHLSIIDWGKYAADHLKGARGREGAMLSPDGYQALHAQVEGQGYGLGWGVSRGEFGRALTHTGSCGEWFSVIRIMPDVDLAIVAATNVSGGNAVAACSDALQVAMDRFKGKQMGTATDAGR